jgi:hypothetical protein
MRRKYTDVHRQWIKDISITHGNLTDKRVKDAMLPEAFTTRFGMPMNSKTLSCLAMRVLHPEKVKLYQTHRKQRAYYHKKVALVKVEKTPKGKGYIVSYRNVENHPLFVDTIFPNTEIANFYADALRVKEEGVKVFKVLEE